MEQGESKEQTHALSPTSWLRVLVLERTAPGGSDLPKHDLSFRTRRAVSQQSSVKNSLHGKYCTYVEF